MQVSDTPAFGTEGSTPGAVPHIQVPNAPRQVIGDQIYNSDEEQMKQFALQPVAPCRYLREKVSGAVIPYTIDFAKRSDLVEEYNPTLKELITLGEDLNEMQAWGYTYENFIAVGVPPQELESRGIQMAAPAAPTQPQSPAAPGQAPTTPETPKTPAEA